MLVPIALGLSWPERLADVDVPATGPGPVTREFLLLDDEAFPAVKGWPVRRRKAPTWLSTTPPTRSGWTRLHDGRIGFLDIVDTVSRVVDEHQGSDSAG